MSSPIARRRPEADDRFRREPLLLDDLPQHRLRVVEQGAGGGALLGIVENGREAALQLPRLEERRPVDVARELREIVGLERARAEKARRRPAGRRSSRSASRWRAPWRAAPGSCRLRSARAPQPPCGIRRARPEWLQPAFPATAGRRRPRRRGSRRGHAPPASARSADGS